jgi:hypothetical protein
MRFMRQITAPLMAVVAIALLTSCSTDGSGRINGPGDGLERKEGIKQGPDDLFLCAIAPVNVFVDDSGLPFALDCENMDEAIHTVTYEHVNGSGCVMEVRGSVQFPSNGHSYSYVAVRDRCTPAGARMTVCGPMLSDCTMLSLPVPTAIDVRQARNASR